MKNIKKRLVCFLLAAAMLVAEACFLNTEVVSVQAASGTQATEFKNMTTDEAVAKIGKLCQKDMQDSGILASVSAAQFILESGFGKSELAQNANNCFGMKCSLSGNTWSGSTWDGKSKYTKQTKESYGTITADFRKYSSVEKSVADHSAYLLNAEDDDGKRYEGLKGEKDYKKAIQIIKDGGYATGSSYVSDVCAIIEKYDLTKYDKVISVKKTSKKKTSKKTSNKKTSKAMKNADCPFYVRVSKKDLAIRKGAGTNYDKTGANTGIGLFTITEVKSGKGSSTGWGKLKSGAGWINLDQVKKATKSDIKKITK